MSILTKLNDKKDKEYKKFQERICHTKYKILGIKIPILRKYANELLKNYNYHDLLSQIKSNSYEEVMLEGIIIGKCQASYEEKLHLITNFLPKIDNWCVCDTFCNSLKIVNSNKEKYFDFFTNKIDINKAFSVRTSIVILNSYYVEKNYIDKIFKYIDSIKSEHYYVRMSIAWLISTCYVKFRDETLEYLM